MLFSGDRGWVVVRRLTIVIVATCGLPLAMSMAAAGSPPPTTVDPRVDPSNTIDLTEPPVAVLPPTVTFDATPVGEVVVETVTLRNEGTSPLTVVDVDVGGEGFATETDDCEGATVDPGESCDVDVRFAPDRAGDFGGLVAMEIDGGQVESTDLIATAFQQSSTTVLPPTTTTPPATNTPPSTTVAPTPTTVPNPTTPGTSVTPPTSNAPPTTLPDDSTAAALRQCNERASDAEVVYARELEMTVGVESEVEVGIGVGGAAPPPPAATTPVPSTIVEPARLTCFIVLELSGTGFEIENPTQSGDFWVIDTGRWGWDVTPLRSGRLDLDLRIVPVIDVGAQSQRGTPRQFSAEISVRAAPRTAWQQVGDASGDVVGHPLFQLAVAVGLVGGAGSYLKGLVASRRDQDGADDTELPDPDAGPGGYL